MRRWTPLDWVSVAGIVLLVAGYFVLDGSTPRSVRWGVGITLTAVAANLWGYVYTRTKRRRPL
jgi:hypothetical protein